MEEHTLTDLVVEIGCLGVHTSAEGVSGLPEEDSDRPEFSPAVSEIGCSQDVFNFGVQQYSDGS